MSAASAGPAAAAAPQRTASDAAFVVDETALQKLVKEKPWLKDPKYFKKAKVSVAAAMKMTAHAASGVDKGLASANHLPVEVMGLMMGHMDTAEPGCLIVTDVFPLPVEGTETSVMTDNPLVTNYMIQLSESLESVRTEHIMGWYHSHPFDVGPHSNAFLSATDVSTQLAWQLSEDRAGNPYLALVVDPLRGAAKGRPDIGAFRCYPPEYTPPRGLAPDGVMWADEKARNARWGESCVSYYCLTVEYFASSHTAALGGILLRDHMWTRTLSSTAMLDKEARDRLPERIKRMADKVDQAEANAGLGLSIARSLGQWSGGSAGGGAGGGAGAGGIGASSGRSSTSEIAEAVAMATEIAAELQAGQIRQAVKDTVFDGVPLVMQSAAEGALPLTAHRHGSGAGGGAGAGAAAASGSSRSASLASPGRHARRMEADAEATAAASGSGSGGGADVTAAST